MADPKVNILFTATDRTRGVLGGIGGALGSLGKVALGIAAGGIAALTTAVAGGVVAASNWGEQLDNLQDLLGTTARESSGLAVMANRVGLSSDEMAQSLSIMTRGLVDVEGQAGPSGKAIAALGINIRDANGNLKDSPTLFQEVSDKLGTMKDGLNKSGIMMDIFGRSGVKMGDLLAEAANGGVTRFQEEAEKLGLSFSQEQIDNVINFGKQTEFLKSAFQGVAAQLGAQLLPAMTNFLNNSVLPFVTQYGPLLAAWLGENIPKAVQFLSDLWSNVLSPAIQTVWNWMSTVLIPFLQDVVFPWLQENIPKALQTLSDFWTNTLWPAIQTVWNWIKTVLIPFLANVVFPWLATNIPKAIKILADFWTDVLQPAIQTLWTFIGDFLTTVKGWWDDHSTQIQAIASTLWALITASFEGFKTAFSDIIALFHLAMEGKWYEFGEKIRSILDEAWEKIKQAARDIIAAVIEFFTTTDWEKVGTDIIHGIGKGVDASLEWIKNLVKRVVQAAIDAAKGLLGIRSSSAPAPPTGTGNTSPPPTRRRSLGGPVLSGLSYLVGEKGPELFMPRLSGAIVPNKLLATQPINNFYISLTGTGQAGADVASTVRLMEMLYG